MEANLNKIIDIRIKKTISNLKKNNMNAVYVPSRKEAMALLESLLQKGESIGVGGSVTLDQIGALNLFRNRNYVFYDRYDSTLTTEEKADVQHKALAADTFVCSSNAITETGYLYNVDGTGTRCAALVYGPKRVIIIAGYNKIVPTLDDAVTRVKKTACPANCIRLDIDSVCSKKGECISDKIEVPATARENCICCSTVITGHQNNKKRFVVIIVGEELGY